MITHDQVIYDLNDKFAKALFDGGCFAEKLKKLHTEKLIISETADISKIRSNAVRFKLLKQEWRDYLKTEITKAAIQNKEFSRSALQNLQRDLFGASQSTRKLSVYLNKKNSKATKIIEIENQFKYDLIMTYIRYENNFFCDTDNTIYQKLIDTMRYCIDNKSSIISSKERRL